MLFIKIADYSGSIEGVVFPKTLKELEHVFMPETCVAVKGRLSVRNGTPSIIIEKARVL
jgi:DNA polymerase III alpha subunit